MQKSDLKTGMVVEFLNGSRSLVLLNTTKGDVLGGVGPTDVSTWMPLEGITKFLYNANESKIGYINKVYDIPTNNEAGSLKFVGKLLWERPEKVKETIQIGEYKYSKEDVEDRLKDLKPIK